MCGIAGIYQLDGSSVEDRTLHQMTDVISYRGPDGFGYWFNENHAVGFGHRRLSILDLSEAGRQPMHYMGLTITFNGEIYNYIELRKELQDKGYVFKTNTDTEVLLAAYHHKGKDCLKDLDGMFSFAIWDEARKDLFAARDRFGEKPFYYHAGPGQFVFGSEIKQIVAAGVSKEVNPAMLYQYCLSDSLSLSSDLKQTFYKNIFLLPHAHCLLVKSDGQVVIDSYWKIDPERRNTTLSLEDAAENFNALLSESISRRLRSDVPVGTSLSGGLDSTTIAGFICRSNKEINLNTFTVSFKDFEKDETKFIKILKDRYPNIDDRYVSPTAGDLMKDLDDLLYHQDEPVVSTSMYAQYRVMKLAKDNNVTVLLDGQGSDEFMAGYNQYWPVRLREMFSKGDKGYAAEKQRIKELLGFEQNISGNLALMLKYPRMHKNLADLKNMLSRSAAPESYNPLNASYFKPEEAKDAPPVNWSDLSAVLNHSLMRDGLQNLLRYADRNSMAHSREVRLPFLYHKLVEFVFTLPSHYKMHDGWSKLLLRKAQDAWLPSEICWRREKVGYETPQKVWMSQPALIQRQTEQRMKLKELRLFDPKFIEGVDSWKILNLYQLLK